jgi:GT2 family glycosyltransferase
MITDINKIAVLITCFNRNKKTLECLEQLHAQKHDLDFNLTIYLVNDGCTDGTEKAVEINFPEVNIIKGDGSLFWNGGMRLAWNEALKGDFDYYLWVNDDSMIYSDAISKILEASQQLVANAENPGAIIGTMVDPISKLPTYGGRLCNSKFNPLSFGEVIHPRDSSVKCNFINGNFTLIPAVSVKKIGILSNAFTHGMGDFDYGLRLKKAGLTCWVAPGAYGECEQNSEKGGCKDASLSAAERIKKMQQLSQLPPVEEWKYFVRQHGGVLWPFLWFKAFLRGRFPKLWVLIRSQKL